MPKRLKLQPHVAAEELERRYRKAKDPVERTHYQIVWLLSEGRSTKEVCEVTGYSPGWVRQIAHRYNEQGVKGLGDRRHGNPGAVGRALLTFAQQQELMEALEAPPEDGGMWSSRKVAEWIGQKTGRKQPVKAQRGWEYLRKLGNTPQVPRPSQAGADPEEQAAFKKVSQSG
jgi:transposase